jgi:DNA-binding response OmpR family regulator
MSSRGRILIADDEETFLHATADLLRREGYECETVPDAPNALAKVKSAPYDLLISDLEMPGNENLSLIREVGEIAGGLPVIIITGFPSTSSAIAAIELPVCAYLLKPVALPDLLDRVAAAVARFRSYQVMRRTEERLQQWNVDFERISSLQADSAGRTGREVDAFLALTLRNVMGSLNDLQQLGRALSSSAQTEHACQILNCPRGTQLQEAIRETVRVLEESKGAFKSKALGDLRHKLELLLNHN